MFDVRGLARLTVGDGFDVRLEVLAPSCKAAQPHQCAVRLRAEAIRESELIIMNNHSCRYLQIPK